jgi:hypothetical protein
MCDTAGRVDGLSFQLAHDGLVLEVSTAGWIEKAAAAALLGRVVWYGRMSLALLLPPGVCCAGRWCYRTKAAAEAAAPSELVCKDML